MAKISSSFGIVPLLTAITNSNRWCLTDEKLLDSLNKKGLKLPAHFNEDFLYSLRKNDKKIFGAEILVIEATKS